MAATTMEVLRAAQAGHVQEVRAAAARHAAAMIVASRSTFPSSSALERSTTTTTTTSLGATALEAASRHGNDDVVDWLLRHVSPHACAVVNDVNAAKRGGWTALHSASLHGHAGVVAKLLRAGANPYLRLANGQTALHLACSGGVGGGGGQGGGKDYLHVVKLLVEWTATTSSPTTRPYYRHNITDDNIKSNSVSSSSSSSSSLPQLLVQAQDQRGWTCLHTASFHGQVDIVQYLVSKAAVLVDVETTTRDGSTPFLLTSSQPCRQNLQRLPVLKALFLQGKADVDRTTDDKGRTALFKAIERRDLSMIRFLLDSCGATVRRADLVEASNGQRIHHHHHHRHYPYHDPDILYPLVAAAASQGFFQK